MLIAVLGTPSPLTTTVLEIVQAIAESVHGSYHWIAAGTADDLRKAWATRGERAVLLFGDVPSRDITKLITDAGVPVLVCLERPAVIVDHLQRTRHLTGLPAIRLASQSLATLHDIALHPNAHRLFSSVAEMRFEELARKISRITGLELDDEQVARVTRKLLAGWGGATSLKMLDVQRSEVFRQDVALAADSLDGYDALINGMPADRFTWPPEVFLGVKPHGEPIAGPIELIGSRRCFAYGPYFHLPSGSWDITIRFEVSNNASGNGLKIDAYTDRTIEEGITRLPRDGHYTCSIGIVIEEPRLPLQIRLFIEEGAIEGRFTLHGVVINRTQ